MSKPPDDPYASDSFAKEPPKPTFSCPNCGHQLEVGTPTCGNCGTVLQGGTYVPPPLGASGFNPARVVVIVLALALTVGVVLARDEIADLFESAGDAVEDATRDITDPGGGGPAPNGEDGDGNGGRGGSAGGRGKDGKGGGGADGEIEYRRIPQVVAAIRAGGIPCSGTSVDASNAYVATGSCQSDGNHVQINLYFDPTSIEYAEDFYAEFAFASVHDANWWVSGDEALMRRIHAVLGGRFKPATF